MKITIAEMIETIKRKRGFKTRKELAEYLSKKHGVDVTKLDLEELVRMLWVEYIETEMES